ncbi:Putative substrate-binding transport protein [Cryobacterium arcticum]|uniref:Putative substrate-binding transport protein n=2 Tax=Cryobacterium arcticum TaxID=670052 RepID=A0A1B1BQE7_9MICO|nr:Putative substrate-binding transport protein [Cryobacterium arcticum]
MRHAKKRLIVASLLATSLVASMAGCANGTAASGSDGKNGELTIWTHNGGNTEELAAVQAIVDGYNKSQDKTTVKLQAFPQASYNDSVIAAAASGKLPCIVDIDGPNVPNWAWAKYLTPLDLSVDLDENLPSTLGIWNGETYSVGYYDVALAMFARKSVLAENGIRQATIDQPWTQEEFDDALAKLKATGTWKNPLDIGTGDVGEWYPYAFSPLLQSFGGDLINRDDYQSADGALNGPEALKWAEWMQSLATDGYIATKSGADSALDFQNNVTAIQYGGSWAAANNAAAIGDDLAVMPSVDLGEGTKIGGGSWQWGVTTGCADPEAAMDYLSYSLSPENIAAVAVATATIPATDAAAALVPGFEEGGNLAIFREFSAQSAVLRPETPAYPFIATEFTKATQDIINGGDPQGTLDSAVKAIDANIKSNGGYTQK